MYHKEYICPKGGHTNCHRLTVTSQGSEGGIMPVCLVCNKMAGGTQMADGSDFLHGFEMVTLMLNGRML